MSVFCRNNCGDCSDFGEIKELISNMKIKNKSYTKIPKFTCKRMYLFIRD